MRVWGGRFFILLLFFSFSIRAYSASFDPKTDWKTIDTEHFSIHFSESLESTAQLTATYLEEVHALLSPKLKWKPWGKTQVLLVDQYDKPNGFASVLPYNWMRLRVAVPGPESSLATNTNWLKMLIMHEYTHIIHLDQNRGAWRPLRFLLGKLVSPNGATPVWIREGIATLQETIETDGGRGRSDYVEMLLRTDIIQNQFLTLDKMNGFGWKWPAGQAPYQYGAKFLQYLADTYGEEKLTEFNLKTSGSLLSFFSIINRPAKQTWRRRPANRHCSNGDLRLVNKLNEVHNSCKEHPPKLIRDPSFYTLWDEWKASLEEKYKSFESLKESPAEELPLSNKGNVLGQPLFSKDGKNLYYQSSSPKSGSAYWRYNLISGEQRRILKLSPSHASLSPDGKKLAYSTAGGYKRYYLFNDLYLKDLENGEVKKLTNGLRARDPDFHPDGKRLLFVATKVGTDSLNLFDIETKKVSPILKDLKDFTQIHNPRFSPSGKEIVFSLFEFEKGWDLYWLSSDGRKLKKLTEKGLVIETRPVWSPDGKSIYYSSSDKQGVHNIFKMNLNSGSIKQITKVKTGYFQPAISPDGTLLIVRHYNGKGYNLKKINLKEVSGVRVGGKMIPLAQRKNRRASLQSNSASQRRLDPRLRGDDSGVSGDDSGVSRDDSGVSRSDQAVYTPQKYSPFRQSLFLPRSLMPGFLSLDDAFLFTLVTGSRDPLFRHLWTVGGSYRTDAKHIGYFGQYIYNKWKPVFGLGIHDSVADYGTLSFSSTTSTGRTISYFEQRRRGYVFASYPFSKQNVALSFFYEDRFPQTALIGNESSAFNLGIYSGFSATYAYGYGTRYKASISPIEKGTRFKINFSITDSLLGSASGNEQKVVVGDLRQFIPLGRNHVIALRAKTGYAFGDVFFPGTFSLGGSLGEGVMAGPENLRYFPVRGLPYVTMNRDKAMLASAEYRLPLASPQRGVGTWPLFLNNLHLAFFADAGDAWGGAFDPPKNNFVDFFDDFVIGVGSELRADLILGNGLPVTGRLGYATIVTKRSRFGGLSDPLLGHPIKNGIFIMQWGTSF